MSSWQFAYSEPDFPITGIEHGAVLQDFGVRAWSFGSWRETFVRSCFFLFLSFLLTLRMQEMGYGLEQRGMEGNEE